MSAHIGNWILERSLTLGAGDITLGGAIGDFATFADAIPAGSVWYSIEDSNGNREAGRGTFNGSGNLARTEIHATLINGTYAINPLTGIALSGESSIAITFNTKAYEELVADIAANKLGMDANTVNIAAHDIRITNNANAINTGDAALTTHINNPTGAHAASSLSYDPTGDSTTLAINVQQALLEHGQSIEERVGSMSGLSEGGEIVGSGTLFTVEAGKGAILNNHSNPADTVIAPVQWNQIVNTTLDKGTLTTGSTHVFINQAGAVFQVPGNLALSNLRNNIFLGTIHFINGAISEVVESPAIIKQTATDNYDLMHVSAEFNGSNIAATTANLSVWVESGSFFFPGVNWFNDRTNPNNIAVPAIGSAGAAAPFYVMTQDGGVSAGTETVIPEETNDTGSNLINLTGNKATIHRLYSLGVGAGRDLILLVGQHEYSTATDAQAGLATDDTGTVIPDELAGAYLLGYVSVSSGAGDFTDPTKAWIIDGIRGGTSGGTSTISAGAVSFTPTGNISATDVQNAITELAAETEELDVNILKANVTDELVVGFTTTEEVLASDTIAPDMQTECLKTRTTAGNITINDPVNGFSVCHIVFSIDASDRTVTLGGSVKAIGTLPTSLPANSKWVATVIASASAFGVQFNEVTP